MKYFRTEDGRIIDLTSKQVSSYEIIDDKTAIDEYGEYSGFIRVYYYNHYIGEHIEYDGEGGHSMDNWYLKDIKFADTIEELKDFYVVDCPQDRDRNSIYTLKQTALHYSQDCLKPQGIEHTIYAAVWTDKGLIHAAKMNDKGKLKVL